jgi:hypothetical protein
MDLTLAVIDVTTTPKAFGICDTEKSVPFEKCDTEKSATFEKPDTLAGLSSSPIMLDRSIRRDTKQSHPQALEQTCSEPFTRGIHCDEFVR